MTSDGPRKALDLLAMLNADHQKSRQEDPLIEARIQSMYLAYRMQIEATDEFGFKAVEKRVHVHNLHATILQLMGLIIRS